jgi:Ni/Co efflux regulator RcnB
MPIFPGNKTWNAHGQERKEERKKGRKERKEGLGKGGREERRTKNDKNERKRNVIQCSQNWKHGSFLSSMRISIECRK